MNSGAIIYLEPSIDDSYYNFVDSTFYGVNAISGGIVYDESACSAEYTNKVKGFNNCTFTNIFSSQ
jgi:hypothetical protein